MTATARWFPGLLMCVLFSLPVAAASPYLVDGDGDAVSDEIDDCPYTHVGVQVDRKGCPLRRDDGDLDGISDEQDDCPYSAAGATVDAQGCALDSDFDGVANGIDRCSGTLLALPVDLKGCADGQQPAAMLAAKPAAPARKNIEPAVAVSKPLPPALPATVVAAPPRSAPPAPAPVVAVVARPAPGVPPAVAASAELPQLLLRFGPNSDRLVDADLALIGSYARVFQKRLAGDARARLHLRAYADYREKDTANLSATRMSMVRAALVSKGIAADRIQADAGVLRNGEARSNRRVEVLFGN